MRGLYISTGVAARWFGVSRRTVAEWVKSGKLPGVRMCATCGDSRQLGIDGVELPSAGCRGCRYWVYREAAERMVQAAKA